MMIGKIFHSYVLCASYLDRCLDLPDWLEHSESRQTRLGWWEPAGWGWSLPWLTDKFAFWSSRSTRPCLDHRQPPKDGRTWRYSWPFSLEKVSTDNSCPATIVRFVFVVKFQFFSVYKLHNFATAKRLQYHSLNLKTTRLVCVVSEPKFANNWARGSWKSFFSHFLSIT